MGKAESDSSCLTADAQARPIPNRPPLSCFILSDRVCPQSDKFSNVTDIVERLLFKEYKYLTLTPVLEAANKRLYVELENYDKGKRKPGVLTPGMNRKFYTL